MLFSINVESPDHFESGFSEKVKNKQEISNFIRLGL